MKNYLLMSIAIFTIFAEAAQPRKLGDNHLDIEYIINSSEDINALKPYLAAKPFGMSNFGKEEEYIPNIKAALLHHVAGDANLEAAIKLLEAGADINIKDTEGNTALHWALLFGVKEVMVITLNLESYGEFRKEPVLGFRMSMLFRLQTLDEIKERIKSAITANIEKSEELDPMVARGEIEEFDEAMFDEMAKQEYEEQIAIQGIPPNKKEMVKLLVHKGVNINERGELGVTALHLAVATGDEDIISFLIDEGADIHMVDDFGVTALHVAAFAGKENIIQLLLKSGADISIKDNKGQNALDIAIEKNNKAASKLLEYVKEQRE